MKVIQLIVLLAISGKIAARMIRSVGGSSISIEKAPYFVSIQRNSKHRCGGALVTAEHVVTAVFCFGRSDDWFQARVVSGIDDKYSRGTSSSIAEVHVIDRSLTAHDTNPWPDIAVIRLSEPLALTTKQGLIALPRADPSYGETASLIAFETTTRSSQHAKLHQFQTVMVYYDVCAARSGIKTKPGIGILCGWHRDFEGMHIGDAGSPLVHNDTLVGIASARQPHSVQYDYYLNVIEYVDFIREKTGLVDTP